MNQETEDNVIGDIFCHKKSGNFYQVLGFGLIEATETHAVIYQDIHKKLVWIRPTKEFFDGRFEFVKRQKE